MTQLEADDIKKLLPHRYPFLLVDRLIKIEEDYAVGIKNVTINEPFFQGHFPSLALMPGVLIVEAMAQLAGIVEYKQKGLKNAITYFAGIDKVRFRGGVRPGDQLVIEIRATKRKAKLVFVSGNAKVGDKVVCEGDLIFALM